MSDDRALTLARQVDDRTYQLQQQINALTQHCRDLAEANEKGKQPSKKQARGGGSEPIKIVADPKVVDYTNLSNNLVNFFQNMIGKKSPEHLFNKIR